MTSPELPSRLEDILEAMAAIAEYTAGKSFDDYAAERMLRDAVERNIERISEASRHIPKNLKARHPEIPWRKVAGIGDILRHAYPIVDDSAVWKWWLGISRPSKQRSRRCCATSKAAMPNSVAAAAPVGAVAARGEPWQGEAGWPGRRGSF